MKMVVDNTGVLLVKVKSAVLFFNKIHDMESVTYYHYMIYVISSVLLIPIFHDD